jgi:valyl-tRNA synthetase
VLAKKGEKISKSKNNSELSPSVLIENHSADVIRYWAANSKLGTDTFFSVDELAISKRFITKLWNASKFCISHLEDIGFNGNEVCRSESCYEENDILSARNDILSAINDTLSFESGKLPSVDRTPLIDKLILPVDKWIIERCKQTTKNARELLNKYEIGSARLEIDDFFWKDFCDYYLEIVKERLYQPEIHGYKERQSAQSALYYCLLNIIKLYAIYVPHITEYIYQEFFRQYEGDISLHRLCWNKDDDIDNNIILFGEKLKKVIAGARRYKSENNLSMKADMEKVTIHDSGSFAGLFRQTVNDIKACCRAKEVEIL